MTRWIAAAVLLGACHHAAPAPDGGSSTDAGQDAGLTSQLVDARFYVAQHMRASREMQFSGEPFAQILGYNLNGFDRLLYLTDQYQATPDAGRVTDPLGYALAVESYEYSKQPMNNLSFESGAGLALFFGPVLNPGQLSGDAGYALLLNRFQQFAVETDAGGPGGASSLIVSPAPTNNPLNYYGWPGVWPVFAEFSDFDTTIFPLPGNVNVCTFGGGAFSYGTPPSQVSGTLIANYECDYNSLHLSDRDGQVTKQLVPEALGDVAWKQGLWVINYWQTMHDNGGNGITWVDAGDVAAIGQPGNTVVGQYPDPTDPTGQRMLAGVPGVYLGDIPMEGWQGLTMMEEMDNKAQFLLSSLLLTDGGLNGVSILAADDYGYDGPLLYFPASVAVTEVNPSDPALLDKYFPQPTQLSVSSADSHLESLTALVGGFGEAFALTDLNNALVGGSIPFLATFDGDPFPMDDGLPDGESTLHDRALGVIKVALVDLDRLHWDPAASVLVDTASAADGGFTRGTTVTTVQLAEAIVGLRNGYRALNGSLQLYSNDTPDTLGAPAALDAAPLSGASYTGTLQSHITTLIAAEADFLVAHLIDVSGAVANGYDVGNQMADASPTTLESEAAAIRGLLDAYLATSDASYRTSAIAVYADLQARFWMGDIRSFRTEAGQDASMQFTPARVGALSGALRQYYKLVANTPSRAAEAQQLLAELKRFYKLVVNGWDDKNEDDRIQYPDECLAGGMAIGGMEMGERALTGELGNPGDDGDRDTDCVREISWVNRPAALAGELDIQRP